MAIDVVSVQYNEDSSIMPGYLRQNRDICVHGRRYYIMCVCVCVYLLCVRVSVYVKLNITAQSGPAILVILCHSH